MTTELAGKRVDLLRELVPQAMTVAYLVHPLDQTVEIQTGNTLATARAIGLQVIVLEVRSDRDFEAAFANLVQRRAGALVLGAFPLFTHHIDILLALVARHSIPAIYPYPEFARAGGLMSYSANRMEAFRRGGVYVGRILNGAKPAELPFQQTSNFELIINLKAAKALGLTVPPSLLTRADEVIE
jgi:putative tryptophan/tyrosine transport system substrate-binding protein